MHRNLHHLTFWHSVWHRYCQHPLGLVALSVVAFFLLIAIYAPFLASSKPLFVEYENQFYFPLFRYLFYKGFYTKPLDLFYNLLIFTFPFFILCFGILKGKMRNFAIATLFVVQIGGFLYLNFHASRDPTSSPEVNRIMLENLKRQHEEEELAPLSTSPLIPTWKQTLQEMISYAKLNLLLHHKQILNQQEALKIKFSEGPQGLLLDFHSLHSFPTLWNLEQHEFDSEIHQQETVIQSKQEGYHQAYQMIGGIQTFCQSMHDSSIYNWIRCAFLFSLPQKEIDQLLSEKKIVDTFLIAQGRLQWLQDRHVWIEQESKKLNHLWMPLIRPFHWEEDAGGGGKLNQQVDWKDLTRLNRKDLTAALIFGTRVSLSVGILAIGLALLIGIPIGAVAGFYGGKIDLLIYRLIEIWESMPTFFMLLMVVAFLQSKSIFLVILVIGLFGWTGFSRFIRGEYFRQKQLPYVEACHAMGYRDAHIMFSHLLPNAIPPVLTLVPFAIMGAMTSEAGLSFLGLGEEGSSSWGVLMDEGRSAFPEESYLLWPPAIMLTVLLVAIALVGDSLRDALDPKLRR